MPPLPAKADLEPSEIWDLVKVLGDKLKDNRKQLHEVQEEKAQLLAERDTEASSSESLHTADTPCSTETCSSACRVKELKRKLKTRRIKMQEKIAQKDSEIEDLRRQLNERKENIMANQGAQADIEKIDLDDNEKAMAIATASSNILPVALKRASSARDPQVAFEEIDLGRNENAMNETTEIETFPQVEMKRAPSTEPDHLANCRPELPDWSSLQPTTLRPNSRNPVTSIHKNVLTACESKNPVFCGHSIVWDSNQPYRAYYLLPQFFYHSSATQWIRNTRVDDLKEGSAMEVFYSTVNPPHVYYAGTYLCTKHEDASMDVYPSTAVTKTIRGSILGDSAPGSAEKTKACNHVDQSYRTGKKKLTCLSLDFVGFNWNLYNHVAKLPKAKVDSEIHSQRRETTVTRGLKRKATVHDNYVPYKRPTLAS
ncbi:hypothetical protein EIP91_010471 [Steccherinum ochraceum]|uniref:Uncharacterized protein n=1 Tax=Steccherinum ochraceum TaxID=92696 RepID=A0A4R0RLU0_9APHY|nr:hypothetical protein EIP91_010471 [Steccherinum ochraceum]